MPHSFSTTATFVAALLLAAGAVRAADQDRLDSTAAARFAALALACVSRPYPNHVSHTLNSDDDARPPRQLTPAFYGCLDWHSSVHGHWLLARLARLYPEAPFAGAARNALNTTLTPANIAGEVGYFSGAGRASFERPYGLAWFLQLSSELHAWSDPDAARWAATIAPLERTTVERLENWLPNLHYPIRIGEHSQTAFSFGLILDWARARNERALSELVIAKTREFYLNDGRCPIGYEPSGEDFLSPCLAEADLMRRVLEPHRFAVWLSAFLPEIIQGSVSRPWLAPAIVTDRSDPKLAHLDGLNLSRAWMMEGIAGGLPSTDRRVALLLAAAHQHASAALPWVTGDRYEGSHWLGTFATYLTTGAGGVRAP